MIGYLIEVTICWLLFYTVYRLFLSKETFFTINRWYLLSTLILGLTIPFFSIDFAAIFYQEPTSGISYVAEGFSELEYVIESSLQEAKGVEYSWLTLVLVIYWLGVTISFLRFLNGFKQIFTLYRTGKIYKKENYNLVLTKTPHLPFSFFNYLFWHESIALEEPDSGKIISHEIAHINQWHSVDVLFLEFLGILLWFSPPIYWYKKSLRSVHEYLADAYVLRNTKKKQYGHLLIKQAQSGMQVALANNFIHSQLKKRINMMTRNKSRRKALMRYLPVLPILLLMILVFSNKNVRANLNETIAQASLSSQSNEKYLLTPNGDGQNDLFHIKNLDSYSNNILDIYNKWGELVFSSINYRNDWDGTDLNNSKPLPEATYYFVLKSTNSSKTKQGQIELTRSLEIAPVFPGGEKEMLMFIYKAIKYPAEARKKGIYGTAAVQFIVEKDGSINNPKIVQNIEGGIGQEVLRIVKLMQELPTRWTPGQKDDQAIRMAFTLPVEYRIEGLNPDDTNISKKRESRFKPKAFVTALFKEKMENKENSPKVFIADTKTGSSEIIYKVVDQMPRFPGCDDMEGTSKELKNCADKKMLQFIYKNIKYPKEAREQGIQGIVVIQFLVAKDGSISDAKVVRNVGGGAGEEALRTVNLMKDMPQKWSPGMQDGKPVNVIFNIPVKFKLEKEEKTGQKLAKTTSGEIIYKVVEQMPRFPGCDDVEGTSKELKNCADKKMLQFIYKNIKYPKEAREKNIQGTVVIQFLVAKDGSINDAKIVRNVGGGAGEEALRTVNLMREMPQKWIAGMQDGKAVNVNFNLPIKFKLEKDKKAEKDGLSQFKNIDIKNGEKSSKVFIIDKKTASGEIRYKIVVEKPPFSDGGDMNRSSKLNLETKPTISEGDIIINAFPNPAKERLTISFKSKATPIILTVFDVVGKEIYREKLDQFDGVFNKTISLDKVAKGTLIINVQQNGKSVQKKVIVQ